MLGAQSCIRTIAGIGTLTDQSNAYPPPVAIPLTSSSSSSCLRITSLGKKIRVRGFVISCNSSSRGGSGPRSSDVDDRDRDYLQASLLLSETISHYQMRRPGYRNEVKWPLSQQFSPLSIKVKGSRTGSGFTSQRFLHRFHSPTIFLKITCDGDFLLPITVGEYAVEKLIDAQLGDEPEACPDQFQFLKNLSIKVGYEIKMVRITDKVVNTYIARLYFSQPGKDDVVSVDLRPSDAINIAYKCKVPIYVSKQIVLTDAIRFGYGTNRVLDGKAVYDVLLDSAADGPDLLAEELDMVRKMNLAVQEERYNDAAIWRDKLSQLRKSNT